MKTEEKLLERIVVNPKVMGGKPVVKGTRITVEQVLKLLAQSLTSKEILKDYPHLTKDDIAAVLLYAAKVAGEEDVYPVTLSLIHISEPTRRTPISYAVFCLKK